MVDMPFKPNQPTNQPILTDDFSQSEWQEISDPLDSFI